MKQDKFDWKEYFNLANSINKNGSEAELRNGVSKFYNAAFCLSRNYLLENKLFLDKTSKKRMISDDSKVHSETINIFKNHKKLNYSQKGKKISNKLNYLRRYRNHVDYDDVLIWNPQQLYNDSKILSESIINLLDELN